MMNPWDRERIGQPAPGNAELPSAGNGWAWLIAVIVAVVALIALARSNGNHLVMIPIGISVFFMFMFLVSHRREARRVESARIARRINELQANQPQPMGMAPYAQARDDSALRRVFDRFDLKVIELGRNGKWEPKEITSLLEMARDFVDTPHAVRLMNKGEGAELDRHLDASLERALLQFDIANNRKGDARHLSHYYTDEPPF